MNKQMQKRILDLQFKSDDDQSLIDKTIKAEKEGTNAADNLYIQLLEAQDEIKQKDLVIDQIEQRYTEMEES